MKARCIVNRLLEADEDDFSPEAAKDYALGAQDYNIQKLPTEIASVLEYAPHEFVRAFFNKEESVWERDYLDNEWWLSYDDDDGKWSKAAYYTEYRTENGSLIQGIYELDSDGERDFSDEAEVGTSVWRVMLEPYAYYQWAEANAAYSKWVAEHGEDPLDFFSVKANLRVDRQWLIGFTQDGDRARFWKAREVGVPGGSPPAINNPAQLPAEVQAYVNVDAEGINQDATWTEIVALTQQADDSERPELKRARDGTDYAQFKVKLQSDLENDNYVKELKAAALKAARREQKEVRSAKRQHSKMPHYVV
jgi:hypothetical protein